MHAVHYKSPILNTMQSSHQKHTANTDLLISKDCIKKQWIFTMITDLVRHARGSVPFLRITWRGKKSACAHKYETPHDLVPHPIARVHKLLISRECVRHLVEKLGNAKCVAQWTLCLQKKIHYRVEQEYCLLN